MRACEAFHNRFVSTDIIWQLMWHYCVELQLGEKNDSRVDHLHLIQLFIDLLVILVVFTELGDQGSVGQREQLRVLTKRTNYLHVIGAEHDLCSKLYESHM